MSKFKIKGKYVSKSEVEKLASEGLKYCSKCKEVKKFNEFRAYKKSSTGYSSMCAECDKARQRKHKKTKYGDVFLYDEKKISKKVDDHINNGIEFEIISKRVHFAERKALLKRGLKWCSGCMEAHVLSDFKTGYSTMDGLSGYCKNYKINYKRRPKVENVEIKENDKARDIKDIKLTLAYIKKSNPNHKLDIKKAAEYHRMNKGIFAARYKERLRNGEI